MVIGEKNRWKSTKKKKKKTEEVIKTRKMIF